MCASKIVALFEDPAYKDDDPKMVADIVALMSEVCPPSRKLARANFLSNSQMQEHGTPPAEIMGELPPGLEIGPDGAPELPEGCIVV